jgi:CRISPR-associated endonuclease/helicase Cas3
MTGPEKEPRSHTNNPYGLPHYLKTHLKETSLLSTHFSDKFRNSFFASLSRWNAVFHDAAKVAPEIQAYLDACESGRPAKSVPHAPPSARAAWLALTRWLDARIKASAKLSAQLAGTSTEAVVQAVLPWPEIILPIYGHHAGLGNAATILQDVAAASDKHAGEALAFLDREGLVPASFPQAIPIADTRRDLLIRMLLSVLVDADRLDTGSHFAARREAFRSHWAEVSGLPQRFYDAQRLLEQNAAGHVSSGTLSPVLFRARTALVNAALAAADGRPGLVRLKAPTGTGKTRAYLGHAVRQIELSRQKGFDPFERIIVALPFLTIIDELAEDLHRIFDGATPAVLEHHSHSRPDPRGKSGSFEAQDTRALAARLAEENWDAPLVVTSFVQLLESLFSNHPSAVRKVHNIVRSVIVLDEIQQIPVGFLDPVMDVLRTLVEDYGCHVVLSTATQIAHEQSRSLPSLAGARFRDIALPHEDQAAMETAAKRVYARRHRNPLSAQDLAARVTRSGSQHLVVLNSRRDALRVFDALCERDAPGARLHLSTWLCPAHRKRLLADIRRMTGDGRPLFVVSTQLIEAGVNLDFPTVWRDMAGVLNLLQAAGRANREGRLAFGVLEIIELLDRTLPGGEYAEACEIGRTLIEGARVIAPQEGLTAPEVSLWPDTTWIDLFDPSLMERQIVRLMASRGTDRERIQDARLRLDFPEVASKFRLMEDDSVPACVDWNGGHQALDRFLRSPSRETRRNLESFLVPVPRTRLPSMMADGNAEWAAEGLLRWTAGYDGALGVGRFLVAGT